MHRRISYKVDPSAITFKPEAPGKGFGRRVHIEYTPEDLLGVDPAIPSAKPLIIAPPGHMLYTFGIQKDTFNGKESGALSVCLCINRFIEKEGALYDMIYDIYCRALDYVDAHRAILGIRSKESISNLFKSPLKYEDEETGDVKIYAKLISNKDHSKIWTTLVDVATKKKIGVMDCLNKPAKIYPALLFDSVYITGNNAYLQCKLSEAAITIQETNKEDVLHLDLDLLTL